MTKISDEVREQILADLKAGKTMRETAKDNNVSITTVSRAKAAKKPARKVKVAGFARRVRPTVLDIPLAQAAGDNVFIIVAKRTQLADTLKELANENR